MADSRQTPRCPMCGRPTPKCGRQLLPIAEIARQIGQRWKQGPTQAETVRLWITKGLYGVKLRAVLRGRCWFTTMGQVRRFWRKIRERRDAERAARRAAARTPKQRRKAQERARKQLQAENAW